VAIQASPARPPERQRRFDLAVDLDQCVGYHWPGVIAIVSNLSVCGLTFFVGSQR
jgi:hypothetical protein